MNSISLIGAGNLAHSLLPAILKADYKVDFISSKSTSSAQELAKKYAIKSTKNNDDIKSDLIIICTNDKAIQPVAEKLVLSKTQTIIHTSGSTSLAALSDHHENAGVLYPLQTFSKSRKVDLLEIPMCIEATNNWTLEIINQLASKLSNNVVTLSSHKRLHLHLSAVYACNFTNLLYTISNDILEANHIDFSLLHPLILETAKKAISYKPQNVQTGPALRNDINIIKKHKEMLSNEQLEMYELLTKWIKNRYRDKDKA